MPLVVPGINSNYGNENQSKAAEWLNKLAGKRLSDKHDELNFAKQDLPKETRVVESGSTVTQDYNKNRMNVHVGKDGIIENVDFN